MSTYRLDALFNPRAVALVGASGRPGSLGAAVLRNLEAAGFDGHVGLVNPKRAGIDGRPCVPSLDALDFAPDVVVIATPPAAVPEAVESAGRRGAAAVVVITAGLGHGPGSLAEATEAAARRHGLRVVGPNCFGVIAPAAGFNASFAAHAVNPGDVAIVSQSGGVAAGLLEWAARRRGGFSAMVSLGDKLDVDFADCLDFFAADPRTRAIVLYIEAIRDARKFMSAARAASRVKPVVVMKGGRHAAGARAAATHTGAMAGSDAVYDAAFRRAGLLRANDMDELFATVATLERAPAFRGPRLGILTNGGGLGVLAVDRLADMGGTLAGLSPETREALDAALPAGWSRANPVDIIGDADAARYETALEALMADPANDAVLALNVPTALASSGEAAERVAAVASRAGRRRRKPLFAVWIGADEAAERAFEAADIPAYATEADALRGFMHLARRAEAQSFIMETPERAPEDSAPDLAAARAVVQGALRERREWLDPVEISALLDAYGIPGPRVVAAATPAEAGAAAREMLASGGAVAVKIRSPDITHKSDVDGVRLDLSSAEAAEAAAAEMLDRIARLRPETRLDGVTVQPMIRRPKSRELIAGFADDPTFGPVILFGRGGTAVEAIDDKALALPPLDMKLAGRLISRTRVSRVLKGYRNVPAADERTVRAALVRLAQLAADLPELRELDINPLLADADGVLALDARARIAPVAGPPRAGHPRFAIRPYPREWERTVELPDGASVHLRPVRPEDEGLMEELLNSIRPEDLRLRFLAPVKVTHAFLARLVQLDYGRAIAFLALDANEGTPLGVVRLHADADHRTGEYGVLVRSDLKGRGLGGELMRLVLEWAKADGLETVEGYVLRENRTMLGMCRSLGFEMAADPDDARVMHVRLAIPAAP